MFVWRFLYWVPLYPFYVFLFDFFVPSFQIEICPSRPIRPIIKCMWGIEFPGGETSSETFMNYETFRIDSSQEMSSVCGVPAAVAMAKNINSDDASDNEKK